MVTVTRALRGHRTLGLKFRVTLVAQQERLNVTVSAPPTVWLVRSESLSIPKKEWDPAVLEAVTV